MAESHYLALYRKYRPQTFEEVRGRDPIVRTLRNQIMTGHIGHSYLFCGTRGTGKTTIAKIFAKAVNCEHPVNGSPCGKCASCRAIAQDANLNVVEMDAASNNGVDDIRNIIEQVEYSPSQGRYRIYIVDEAHMLSKGAQNSLLKTLEEPPSYAIFILATTEPEKLLPTIISRCQRFDFGRLPADTIKGRLEEVCRSEHITVEDRALSYIAAVADGSMRDGLSILDQCNAFNLGGETLTYDKTLEILGALDMKVFSDLFRMIHEGKALESVQKLDEILAQGREVSQFITDFLGYLRNVMLVKASENVAEQLDISADARRCVTEDARMSQMAEIIRYINVLSATAEQIRFAPGRKTLMETALIRLCEPSMDWGKDTEQKLDSFDNRVTQLENEIDLLRRELAAAQLGAGPSGQAAGAQTAGSIGGMSENAAEGSAGISGSMTGSGADRDAAGSGTQAVAEQLPQSVPEDVVKIAKEWDSLIGAIPPDKNFLKAPLMNARPSLARNGDLMVVLSDPIQYELFRNKSFDFGNKFSAYLSAHYGKKISVTYQLDNDDKATDNKLDIRKLDFSRLHIEVEEDD